MLPAGGGAPGEQRALAGIAGQLRGPLELGAGFRVAPEPREEIGAHARQQVITRQRACVAQGRSEDECETGCECVADAIDHSGDADRLATVTPERRSELKRLADACMGR